MNKAEMEDAVAEMRYLIDFFERGVLEQDYPGQAEPNLRLVLRDRELWLQGGIFVSTDAIRRQSAEATGMNAQSKLKGVEDDARMYTKSQAIEYLRSTGHIGCLNHEPLRKVEQEWLDRIFIRERCSAAWIGLAAVMAPTGLPVCLSLPQWKEEIGDFRKNWANACETAKLAGVIPHDLRRCAARKPVSIRGAGTAGHEDHQA